MNRAEQGDMWLRPFQRLGPDDLKEKSLGQAKVLTWSEGSLGWTMKGQNVEYWACLE